MKMYELFLDKQPLGIFKEEPQAIIYCDYTTDSFTLLCFDIKEWQQLQKKLDLTFTNDENQNFKAIFNSKFCIEKNIEYVDELANELGFGKLLKFGDKEIEYASDLQEKYSFYINEQSKTAGKTDFLDWDMECKGIYQEMDHAKRWILCDSYNELEINPIDGNELTKFNIEKINKEIDEFAFGYQVQGYDIVLIKELNHKNPKDGIKLLVWVDGNTERSFLQYRLEDIKEEWKIR